MKLLPALAAIGVSLLGQEWPQWRGPARDGLLPGFSRSAWPEQLKQRWAVEVGEGHSSPVLAQGRLFVFSREKGEEVLRALDPETGKQLWRQAYPAPYRMNPAATQHGEGPKSTPVLANGRICTLGISGILSCWDSASGKLLWRREFTKEFRATSPLYGTAMSPIVVDGVLMAHVGGHDDGALTAFDLATGAVKWSWKGDGPGYASPVLATLAGIRQIVTQTQNQLVSLAASDGALLWKAPLKTPWDQNSVTPIVIGDTIIYGGLDNPLRAIRPARSGATWKLESVWETPEAGAYMNTPVLRGNLLFGFHFRNKGQYFVLDARTGKLLARSAPRQGDNAALLLAGEHILALNNNGELLVARAAADAWQVLRTYRVSQSQTWAHPAVTSSGICVKDYGALSFWTYD